MTPIKDDKCPVCKNPLHITGGSIRMIVCVNQGCRMYGVVLKPDLTPREEAK